MKCYLPGTDPVLQMGHVVRVGETRGSYRFSVGTHEGERPRVRPRRRWRIVIKWNLRSFGGDVDWGGAVQNRKCLSGCCERGKDPAGSIIRGDFLDKLGLLASQGELLHGGS